MIEFKNVCFGYLQGLDVLDHFSLKILPGLTMALGPNGCGKSTMLKIAAGVEHPRAGNVEIFGHNLWQDEVAARQSLAYLPEHPDLTPYATVSEILQMVCGLRRQSATSVDAALEWTGMTRLASRTVRELSMGQRRRAVLAAARIGKPRCFLLDEPLEAMDRAIRSTIVAWLKELKDQAATIVVVSHEIESFIDIADRAVTVTDGRSYQVDDLGDSPAERKSTLDRLARGLDQSSG